MRPAPLALATLALAPLALAATLLALPAAAQNANDANGGGPNRVAGVQGGNAAQSQPATPSVDHLLGDAGGLRPTLEAHGIDLELDAVSEFAGNVSGGTRRGSTFANQIAFQADIDWQKLAGIQGFSTHLIIVNRSGSSDSHLFGDNLLPVQEIYGAGGNVVAHLVSFYAQQKLHGDAIDIAAGLMNVENDFASSPLYCNYMNNGLCGDPKALPGGDIGHSAYPDAVWAARLRLRPISSLYLESGIYGVNQGLYTNQYDRSGFGFNTSQYSGIYIPIEVGWEPKFGPDQLPGHYKIGFGYDSSHFQTFPTLDGTTARHGNTQLWVLADQMLLRQGHGDQDGLIALAGYIRNNPHDSVYAEQVFAGLLDRGFWPARPHDTIGALFTYNTVSGELGRLQDEELVFDQPLSNGATAVQGHEMILELNYDIHVSDGLNFEPDFQYVFRPNAERAIPDAAVLGFKAHLEF